MKIEISVENKYLNLYNVKTIFDERGKKLLLHKWKNVESFMQCSNFSGKQNLTVTLIVNDRIIFDKTKMKHKEESYQNVFQMLENFLLDKIYFYKKLKYEDKTEQLEHEYIQNKNNLVLIQKLNQEIRR